MLKSLKVRLLLAASALGFGLETNAQGFQLLRPHDMGRWGIPAGNYSGITPIGNGRYALVSDKQDADGWTEVTIEFSAKGDIERMELVGQHFAPTTGTPRDAEGIVAVRQSRAEHEHSEQFEQSEQLEYTRKFEQSVAYTLFVSAESDQRIVELDSLGRMTGRELAVPEAFCTENIFGNYGFEALAYDAASERFWTTTEQGLRRDVGQTSSPTNPVPTLLRLQSFDAQLQPVSQYAYRTEAPTARRAMRLYAFGVPEMTALDDGRLLVLEREVAIRPRLDGSYVKHRLFSVRPDEAKTIDSFTASAADAASQSAALLSPTPLSELPAEAFVEKRLVGEFTTHLNIIGRKDFANYEGMCLGPTLPDGRQTLLLVADSQNRMGNSLFRLKDYIRVAILNP